MHTDPDIANAGQEQTQHGIVRDGNVACGTTTHVRLRHVTKRFGDFTALDDISMEIDRGSVVGIAGSVGAGKTTLMQILHGELQPDAGTVEMCASHSIGYLRGEHKPDEKQTVGACLFTATTGDTVQTRLPDDFQAELVDLAGLSNVVDCRLRDLPAGIRRRAELVGVLMPDPDLVLLDELTIGLPAKDARRLWDLVVCLAQRGKTFVCTVHFMEEALRCGRVAYLFRSHLLACDAPGMLVLDGKHQSGQSAWMALECDHVSLARRIISSRHATRHCAAFGDTLHLLVNDIRLAPEIQAAVEGAGVTVKRFENTAPNLFDVLDVMTEEFIQDEMRAQY